MPEALPLACASMLLFATATCGAAQPATAQELGRRVFAAQCATCHGATGQGQPGWQEPDASGEMPAPPHDRNGHTWKHSDAMLYRIVKEGWRDPYNKTQRLSMPAFGAVLSPQEIRAVIDDLKTLWTPQQRSFQQQESRKAPYPPEARRR
jgi:mono/diheme cytochrome c family protein